MSALREPPERRQACSVSVVPLATTPSASSRAPNPAAPATSRPVRRLKSATSQSPERAKSFARTSPEAVAVTVRCATPAAPAGAALVVQARFAAAPEVTVPSQADACAPAGTTKSRRSPRPGVPAS
jgi:hypothetical protein